MNGHAAMNGESASGSMAPVLRSDLQVVPLSGDRDCMVIDDITGRFSRTKRDVWARIRSWSSETPRNAHDEQAQTLWQQASTAGWTRSRAGGRRPRWSPLSIKLPVASIDPIAQRLVGYSSLVFSVRAIMVWACAGILGVCFLIVRWESWSGSVPTLAKYLASMNPAGIAITFVLTKTVHELGHAVACRRIGSRCGVAGVWLLCFMPCPYVDVTEVWRQSNPLRRAAVMAAGIAAEGVVCVVALWVWLLSSSASVQLAAMNVILICSVSTILFNANPLMRYDGYFILSDLIDSTNLRQEAIHAWHRLLTLPILRWLGEGRRVWSLVAYHFASSLYRWFIFVAIASMILAVSDQWGLWRVAALGIVVLTIHSVWRSVRGLSRVHHGVGKWSRVARHRRWFICLGSLGLIGLVLVMPFPRYRHVQGQIEAKDVDAVYLPGEGMIDEIHVRLGDQVVVSQSLASISDVASEIELVSVSGHAKMLSRRSRAVRMASLSGSQSGSPNDHWDILSEASRAAESRKEELLRENEELEIRSPSDGIVLRGEPPQIDARTDRGAAEMDKFKLSPGKGEPVSNQHRWCRIARSGQLQLTVPLNANDHETIQVGTPIRFYLPGYVELPNHLDERQSSAVHCSHVAAVSPIQTNSRQNEVIQEQTYQAVCDVDVDLSGDLDSLVRLDGAECEVVVHLPARPIWKDLADALRDVGGL